MSVTGISSTLYDAYKKISEQKSETADKENSTSLIAASGTKTKNDATLPGTALASSLSAVSNVLERLGHSGRVTRTAISQYKEKLEKSFEAQVKSDLKELGVDESIDFRVAVDKSGNIVVNTDHADKEKVEAYFKANPGYAQVLKDIETLSNAQRQTESATTTTLNPATLRRSLQMQYLGNLAFGGLSSGGFATNTLNFANGTIQSLLGISKIV